MPKVIYTLKEYTVVQYSNLSCDIKQGEEVITRSQTGVGGIFICRYLAEGGKINSTPYEFVGRRPPQRIGRTRDSRRMSKLLAVLNYKPRM